jgi:hypothetical protein
MIRPFVKLTSSRIWVISSHPDWRRAGVTIGERDGMIRVTTTRVRVDPDESVTGAVNLPLAIT